MVKGGGGRGARPEPFSSLSTPMRGMVQGSGFECRPGVSPGGPFGAKVLLPGHAAGQPKVWSSGDNVGSSASLEAERG
jgi:hypothetical protein